MTPQIPFELQVLALRHPQSGSLWVRRWSATAAHGLRSRAQLQLLWQPLKGGAYEGRWELNPAPTVATTEFSLFNIQTDPTSGRKQADWKAMETAAQPAVPHFANGFLRAAARLGMGRTFDGQTRCVELAQGALRLTDVSDTAASGEPTVQDSDWAGARGVWWSFRGERMPRSLFFWSQNTGAHGLQLALLPGISLSAAATNKNSFERLTLQSAPTRFPFETRWTRASEELDLRILGEGKSTHAFEIESSSGLPADTRVSLAPLIEVQTQHSTSSRAGESGGGFPELFDLSLPLPGAQL